MKQIKINDTCHLLLIDDDKSIAFGSPPEWVKAIGVLPMPQYIFLGNTILKDGMNFAELGFPMFKNFFFNKQRITQAVTPKENCKRLINITRDSLLGPEKYKKEYGWQKAKYFKVLHDVYEDFNPKLRKLSFKDFIQFNSYNSNKYAIEDIKIELVDKDTFKVQRNNEEKIISIDYSNNTIPAKKTENIPGLLSLYCFDSGDGFCPNKSSTSFLVNVEGNYIIFDPNIYAYDIMLSRGYDLTKVKAIFLSHIHQDHNQGVIKFLQYNSEIKIITGDVVGQSVHTFLVNILDDKNASKKYNVITLPLQKKNYLEFLNLSIYCDISYHSIPTVMTKLYFENPKLKKHVLAYSGDTIFDATIFNPDKFNQQYKDELIHFFDDATITIHEAGAGLFHTDAEDLIPFLNEKQKIFWVHTPRTNNNNFTKGHILKRGNIIVIKK